MKTSLHKAILATTLAMFTIFANAQSFEVDGIYYNVTSNTYMTVSVVYGMEEYVGDIIIPDSVVYEEDTYTVTSISSSAFESSINLTSITFPSTLTSIGSFSFYDCNALTSLTIPGSVTSIGSSSFYNCSGLTELTIEEGVESIGYCTFGGCTSLTSVTIPSSVTSIGGFAFYNCTGLTNIVIPDSVTTIDDWAFYGCSSLTSLTIEDGTGDLTFGAYVFNEAPLQTLHMGRNVTSTYTNPAYQPFYGKTTLTELTIGDSVTCLSDSAFLNCTALTTVVIGESMDSIAAAAFAGCTAMTSLTCNASIPPTCDADVFSGVDKEKCTLYVPAGTTDLYKAADQWKDFLNISDEVTAISSATTGADVTDIKEVGRYNINGQAIQGAQPGVNIIRYSDGTTKKVYVK